MYPREYFDTFWRGDLRNEIFVIMSFAEEFQAIWADAIKPAIEEDTTGTPFAHRVDATTLSGSIVTEILDGIAHAKLIFAEISVCIDGRWKGQRNANAMYELGLAHALRPAQELVVVRCDHEEINFDVAGVKLQNYSKQDVAGARAGFARLLNSGLAEIDRHKHLKVKDAIAKLDEDTLNLMHEAGSKEYFSINTPRTVVEMMNQQHRGIKGAVRHLLSLGIVRFDANLSTNTYVYNWTDFGKAVLSSLDLRRKDGT